MATNNEVFSNMTIEEKAKIIESIATCDTCVAIDYCEADKPCAESFKEWLEAEAK